MQRLTLGGVSDTWTGKLQRFMQLASGSGVGGGVADGLS